MPAAPALEALFLNPGAQNYVSTIPVSITSNRVFKFHTELPSYSGPTKLISLSNLASSLGIKNLYVKDESFRFDDLPSFKPLGLSWAIRNGILAELSESVAISEDSTLAEIKAKTKEFQTKLIAASDGKLGRTVARIGKDFGIMPINTRIFVPEGAPDWVKSGVKDEGVEMILIDGDFEKTTREAWLHSVATDGVMIALEEDENYEDIPKWIVEGYSTIFKELDEQLSGTQPDWVVVPVGVGGLAQAAVTHYKALSLIPKTRILAVEPVVAASLQASLRSGVLTNVDVGVTTLQSLRYGSVASAAWPVLKAGLDASYVINDESVQQAIEELDRSGYQAGQCGGAVLAALKEISGMSKHKTELMIDEETTVVLIGTDGPIV